MELAYYNRAQKVLEEAERSVAGLRRLDQDFWFKISKFISERSGKLILTGVGKSGYIAMKVSATLTSLGHAAIFVHPVEALHGDFGSVSDGDVIIAFSFSGNTKELVQFVKYAKRSFVVDVVGVTGYADSGLGRLSEMVIPIAVNEEGCPLNLAPMASTTAMLVAGDALAAAITSPEQFTRHDFVRFHPSGTLGLELTTVELRATMNENIAVFATTPLQEALVTIGSVGKGLIGVVSESRQLLGSITDGDVRRFFAENATCEGFTAADVMGAHPKFIRPKQSLKEALYMMESHKITNLFVVNEERVPIGIIHIHDIIEV